MTIANHPVWPFPPNWTSSVSETLEWLTDVLASPSGAEQRRSMRYYPRRSINYTIAVEGSERTLLDNLLMSYSARDWYLPVWYDVTLTTAQSTTINIPCAAPASIKVGTIIFVTGATVYDYQITEVMAVNGTGVTVSPALTRTVPAGTVLHPMTVGRLVEQPALTAMSDAVETAEPQFLIVEPPVDTPAPPIPDAISSEYRDFRVLTLEPDWSDRLDRGHQRRLDTISSEMGYPEQADTANRPFPTQSHKWVLDGDGDHAQFYALLQTLRGKAIPVWVPTWMYDMRLALASASGSSTLTVARCGFALSGGPRPEREDIMIQMTDGQRIYRRITAAATDSQGREILLLDQPLTYQLREDNVLRICFMSLMRLDQDSVEIEHLTDIEGVSEVEVTFRAAPNLRVPEAAF